MLIFGMTITMLVASVVSGAVVALQRRTYHGCNSIYGLARIESTAPEGSQAMTEWHGHAILAPDRARTDNGNHLKVNEACAQLASLSQCLRESRQRMIALDNLQHGGAHKP